MTSINSGAHQALDAYHKVLKSSQGISSSPVKAMQVANQSMQKAAASVNIDKVAISSPSAFPSIVKDLIDTNARKVEKAERIVRQSIKPTDKGSVAGPDLVSVISAVHESQIALDTIVSVRDKIVSAYETIIKMPI